MPDKSPLAKLLSLYICSPFYGFIGIILPTHFGDDPVFNMTLKTMALPKEAVVMVGDRILTDILGAQRAGIRSVLVKTGEFSQEELNGSIRPDYSIDSIASLLEVLQIA
jgi:FMN phosphatase YigB (HAD superfamily)